ncbi:MAG: GNAT family N-acetyltransferase [Kordiimonadaceae bacterium]|jgi:[ribosomal protein S5]-alanine N-acetyltransferase|nr:GNAT family N-acetyltransferase [Kordiimonadaceae bacterium]MBT6032950.1 GNAT family N-acetyltransferase [Kordiimonadaceae bacterium]
MIKFIPLKAASYNTLATGDKINLQMPNTSHKKKFIHFIKRNRNFHEPWIYISSDPQYFDQYIRRMKSGHMLGFFVFSNHKNADGHNEFIGVVNLNNIRLDPFGSASLGYYADQDQSGKGYMKEALKLVLDHAFSKIGLNRVEVNIQPENTSSLALVKSVGFQKEGYSRKYLQIGDQYRDHERWAYLADDYY